MKTIGQIFKGKREQRKITLAEVEKATKIRQKFLEALEKGEYDKLPQAAFTRGFVKNYAEFLGLPTWEILALYRREYDEGKDKKLLPEGVVESGTELTLITPTRLTVFFLALLFLAFFAYLFSGYQQLAGAPLLVVTKPLENSEVNSKEIVVAGKTDQEVVVKINEQMVNVQNGSFNQAIVLSEGLNTITISAIGKRGKTTTVERHIRLLDSNR